MIKRFIIPVVISLLVLGLVSPVSAAAATGKIEGVVVNKSPDGGSVTDLTVTLRASLDQTPTTTSPTVKTDSTGHFVFNDVLTDTGYEYAMEVTYQKVTYWSGVVSFAGGETSKTAEIAVYEPTTSDEGVRTTSAHSIIYIQPDTLQIKEYYLFVNDNPYAYVGDMGTLTFTLPPGATQFTPTLGATADNTVTTATGFVVAIPVSPAGAEVAYSYALPNTTDTTALSTTFNYPTANYDFVVQGTTVKVASDQLQTADPLAISGVTWQRLHGENLTKGEAVTVQFSGLLAATAAPATSGSPNNIYVWVLAGAAIFIAGGGATYFLMRRTRMQPAVVLVSSEAQQSLLAELAKLDDEFAQGKIEQALYDRQRAEKKAQLVGMMRTQGDGRG